MNVDPKVPNVWRMMLTLPDISDEDALNNGYAQKRYDKQRPLVTREVIQAQTSRNDMNLKAPEPKVQAAFHECMRAIADQPGTSQFLLETSIASLQHAEELA